MLVLKDSKIDMLDTAEAVHQKLKKASIVFVISATSTMSLWRYSFGRELGSYVFCRVWW